MRGWKSIKISFSSLILMSIVSTATLLTGAVLLGVIHESRVASLKSAEVIFRETSEKTISEINVIVESISSLTDVASLTFAGSSGRMSEEYLSDVLRKMKFILDENPTLLSSYVGYADGQFHQVIACRDNSHVLKTYDAPEDAAYIDRIITPAEDGVRRQTWRFLAADLRVLSSRTEADVAYDPRQRPWYLDAEKSRRSVYTAPYVFSSSRLPGITCARVLADGGGVFGVDVSLSQLGELLARQRVTPHGTLWIVDEASRLVAVPGQAWERLIDDRLQLPLPGDVTDPVVRLATLAAVSAGDGFRAPRVADIDGTPYLATLTPMADDHGLHFRVIVAAPLEDVTGHITDMALRIVLLAAAILGLAVPLAMHLARRVARPVRLLCEEAGKIQRFDFSASPAIQSHVSEMQALATACEVMKSTIRAKTESLLDTQATLEKLVAGGMAFSAEKDMARLVTLIFQTAKDLAGADGGVLYLMEGEELEVELLSLHAESLVLGGLSENPAPRVKVRPEIMPFLQPHCVLRHACEALRTRKASTTRDEGLSLFPTGLSEEPKDYRIASLVTVPLVTRRDEVLGVIQLFNPHIPHAEDADDGAPDQGLGFIGSLAAQAAVALDNHHLVLSLRDLFDALIQVIASSIDAKSPYTAGHCTRVPVLTEMLARAVHETTDGPLGRFYIETDDEWRQLWIASWLHDCGKVTTPEYVVDKATKLETIYNRINEIRMRFEVLRRDAEIAYLRRSGHGQVASEGLEQEFAEEIRRLHADFEFVAACNVGGEFLSDGDKTRLEQIASRQWMRHFNDRVGLSEEELGRKAREAEPELPTPETLLADKPEHVIPRKRTYPGLVDVQGNPLLVPENEYNRGELYNLRIARGTLTPEERFKINEHMLNGLEMLQKIPFPEQLGRVTEIATGHHETLIGTGYPLKKTKEQLPVEARIMAIADIFEALTAADRPYKKAKTLSEALGIMSRMRNNKHIDPDIFDIFLTSGVFSAYAVMHLAAFQRDVTDIGPYLSQPDACEKN